MSIWVYKVVRFRRPANPVCCVNCVIETVHFDSFFLLLLQKDSIILRDFSTIFYLHIAHVFLFNIENMYPMFSITPWKCTDHVHIEFYRSSNWQREAGGWRGGDDVVHGEEGDIHDGFGPFRLPGRRAFHFRPATQHRPSPRATQWTAKHAISDYTQELVCVCTL